MTGLTTCNAGVPDDMRGEETQIVGAAAMGQLEGTFVLPGTHSKWARVRAGRVEAYATYMTGELYAALRDHSILGKFMRPGPLSEEGLRLGVEAARRSGGELLHTLFSARTLPLFGHISEDMVADYLSGLLIGAEIGAALAGRPDGRAITVIGRGDLCDRYLSALGVFGIDARRAAGHAAAYGQARIAQACNLTTSVSPGLGVA